MPKNHGKPVLRTGAYPYPSILNITIFGGKVKGKSKIFLFYLALLLHQYTSGREAVSRKEQTLRSSMRVKIIAERELVPFMAGWHYPTAWRVVFFRKKPVR